MVRSRVLGWATVLVLANCTSVDRVAGPARWPETKGGSSESRSTPNELMREGTELARALALGLAVEPIRLALRDALRDSPYSEHKLLFHDLLQTQMGKSLITKAAARSGLAEATLLAYTRDLPALELYLPSRQHRVSWKCSADIRTAFYLPGRPPSAAFAVDGGALVPDWNQTPGFPILMLQPAEARIPRLDRRTAPTSLAVQDPEEDQLAVGWLSPTGELMDLGRVMRSSSGWTVEPTGCVEPRGGARDRIGPQACDIGTTNPPDYTRLKGLQVFGVCDNDLCGLGDDNEFEFRATVGATGARATLRVEGVPSNYASNSLSLAIISTTPAVAGVIEIKTVETDGWPSADDNFPYVTYQPNTVGPVPLGPADNGRGWPLKEQPYIGPFDPVKVAVVYGWP